VSEFEFNFLYFYGQIHQIFDLKKKKTFDWLLHFPKKNDNASMMANLQQIFC